jgi:hypothetical protein
MGNIQHNNEMFINHKDGKGCPAKMDITISFMGSTVVLFIMLMVWASQALADENSEGSVKAPDSADLKLPYAFYNKSFGAAVGYVYGSMGYPKPQSTTIATVIAGSNSAVAFYLLSREIPIPYTGRFFLDTDLAISHFGTIQSFINGNPDFPNEQAGSNGSNKDNFLEGSGDDNLVRLNIKYLLPIGIGRDMAMVKPPELDRGLPVESAMGGDTWNPLISGRTFIEVRPYWREQTIDSDDGKIKQKTNGTGFSLYRDNTDFVRSPSKGSTIRLRYTQDWGWFDTSNPYKVVDLEFSKYLSLDSTDTFRQRVLAFDFWTANTPSWDDTSIQDGKQVFDRPPAYLGATLGGLWRMRGYPTSRFHDQAAVYYACEYRLIPEWNPFAQIDWIQKYLGIEWWQWVPFVEAGRVAPVWTVHELHSSMKWDAGFGVRAMAKGIVGRIDIAASKEGFGINMMVGQPYQF